MATEQKLQQLFETSKKSRFFEGIGPKEIWNSCLKYKEKSDLIIDLAIRNIQKKDQQIIEKSQKKLATITEQKKTLKLAELTEHQKEEQLADQLLQSIMAKPIKKHNQILTAFILILFILITFIILKIYNYV